MRQFLTESVLISAGGGLLGIGFGFFLAFLIARTAEWKTIVTPISVIVAFTVSVAVGIVFGLYPAVKASRINPIDALRYEQSEQRRLIARPRERVRGVHPGKSNLRLGDLMILVNGQTG